MSLLIILIIIIALVSLLLLGFGAYALYEGFVAQDSDFLGNPKTARIVGIIVMALALAMICLPVVGGILFMVTPAG